MDSFGRPNLSVERGIRLAGEHLDEAITALRAEQRTREQLRRDFGEQRLDVDVTYTGDGTAPGADKAMTPDEIRVDELANLIERLGMVDIGDGRSSYWGEVQRVIKGRIDALRPEQTSSDEEQAVAAFKAGGINVNAVRRAAGLPEFGDVLGGIRYRQEASDALIVHGSVGLSGEQLSITIRPRLLDGSWTIPPYQVDQLRAIVDGRPSWPEPSSPRGPIDARLVDWIVAEVERRLKKAARK